MKSTRQLTRLVEELFQFTRTYGVSAFLGTDEELRAWLQWYLCSDRILVLRDQGQLTGAVCYHFLAHPHDVREGQWPIESVKGKYLYVSVAVIHPLYQGIKLLVNLLRYAVREVPWLEYVYFARGVLGDRFEYRILPLRKLQGDPIHG